MAKKRVQKRRSATVKRYRSDHNSYAPQCPFCFGEMRMSKKRLRSGSVVITFRCKCGTKLEALFVPDDYIGELLN